MVGHRRVRPERRHGLAQAVDGRRARQPVAVRPRAGQAADGAVALLRREGPVEECAALLEHRLHRLLRQLRDRLVAVRRQHQAGDEGVRAERLDQDAVPLRLAARDRLGDGPVMSSGDVVAATLTDHLPAHAELHHDGAAAGRDEGVHAGGDLACDVEQRGGPSLGAHVRGRAVPRLRHAELRAANAGLQRRRGTCPSGRVAAIMASPEHVSSLVARRIRGPSTRAPPPCQAGASIPSAAGAASARRNAAPPSSHGSGAVTICAARWASTGRERW